MHSSPLSLRPANESPDYDSSPDCCSVYDDYRHDLIETDSPAAANDWQHRNHTIGLNNNCDDDSEVMASDQFNNRRNNLVMCASAVSAATLIDKKISDIIMKNKCHTESFNYDKQIVSDFKQNSSDVESQKGGLKRNKSLIKRLYSGSGRRKRLPVTTRLSILGRPIPCHRLKNDIGYYQERVAVYNFLQRPSGRVAIGYHIIVSLVVSVCLLLTIFSTVAGQ